MRRILLVLLALSMLMTAALAEADTVYPFGGFELAMPADATIEEYESSVTVALDQTRVVVQLIPQDLAEDGQAQVRDLLTIYNKDTAEITDVPLTADVYGAMGLIEDRFDDGIHEVPMLILADGELLILAGYNLQGDTLAVHELLTALLSGVTRAGEPILPSAAAAKE